MKKKVLPKGGSVTIETVAAAAGVSSMTVSRVLRGTGNVADGTRGRVHAAMRELGYVRNRLASGLASAHSAQIAVIVPTLRSIVFTEVLAGIADALDGSGYQPVIGISEYQQTRELELVQSMMAWRPAGFLLAGVYHLDQTRITLSAADVPVVELMELTDKPIDMCVGLDQAAAGAAMAEHLLQRGYRRFGYLGSDHHADVAAARRLQGFIAELQGEGAELVATLNVPERFGIELGRNHAVALLAQAPDIDAVYCANDAVAAGTMMYCLSAGIEVPAGLAIAGFSGLDIAAAMPVPITTIKSPRFDIGRAGAEANSAPPARRDAG